MCNTGISRRSRHALLHATGEDGLALVTGPCNDPNTILDECTLELRCPRASEGPVFERTFRVVLEYRRVAF